MGGHCIPLDPQFLAWRAKEANFAIRFIDLAEQVNTKMPSYTAGRVADRLDYADRLLGSDEEVRLRRAQRLQVRVSAAYTLFQGTGPNSNVTVTRDVEVSPSASSEYSVMLNDT